MNEEQLPPELQELRVQARQLQQEIEQVEAELSAMWRATMEVLP